jgi:probable HAF family extracellular repeat protein
VKSAALLLAVVVSTTAVALSGQVRNAAAHDRSPGPYRIAALDSLGGAISRGNSINDWGLIAGYSDLPEGRGRRASLWYAGHQLPLGTLGGPNSSVAWPVKNNIGLVVGIAQTNVLQPRGATWSCRIFFPGPDNTRYQCLGFVWNWIARTMTALPTLGGDNGFAAGANNQRQVVGWAENDVVDETCETPTQVLQFRAVRWDLVRNRTHALDPFGDDTSGAATAINDRGQIVGISGICDQAVGRFTARHAVLWEDGVPRNLGDLGAGAWNTPTAINQRGDVIAGFAMPPGEDPFAPNLRAVVWTTRKGFCTAAPGTQVCDLGVLDGHVSSQASGVNNRGQVVGTSCPASGRCRAFVWENGVMRDLNDLKGAFADHLENGQDINERGQITGRAIEESTGTRLAFLATPARSER